MRKINVLHLITSMNPGGAENLIKFQYSHFNKEKFNIHVGYLIGEGSLIINNKNFKSKNFSFKGKFNPFSIFSIISYIKKYNITIIHSHLIHAGIIARFISFLVGNVKIISTRHYAKASKDSRLINKFEFFLLKNDLKIICISNYVKNYLIEKGIPDKKLSVIYNGIDLNLYNNLNKANKNNFTVGTIGRLSEQKGIDITLKAFKKVLLKYPNLNLEIVGEGELKDEYKLLANRLKIENRVKFLGYLQPEAVIKQMQSWEIFVLPSRWEGFGMVLIEAGAVGLPVISTNVEAIPEIIQDNFNGYIVAPNDYNLVADRLLKLISSEENRIKMGQNGKISANKNFSIEKMVLKTEKIYETLESK